MGLGIPAEVAFAVAAFTIAPALLLYATFQHMLGGFADIIVYFYFSLIAAGLGLAVVFAAERSINLGAFSALAAVTLILLIEEALINGLYPDLGFAVALAAALTLPLAGSVLRKLRGELRYALQASGLMFASRLVFIPFPQRFLAINTALPSVYALIIALVIAFIAVKRVSFKKVGLARGQYSIYKQISVGAAIGILSGLLEYFILKPSPIPPMADAIQAIAYVIIVMVVFVGFGEEVLFRGLVQESYQNVLPAWLAIQVASVQFGVMHYGWLNPLEILFAYAMGLIFGYSFWSTGSLIAPITAHGLGNIVMFQAAAYPEIMLDPNAMAMTIIVGAALLMPMVPWRRLLRAEAPAQPPTPPIAPPLPEAKPPAPSPPPVPEVEKPPTVGPEVVRIRRDQWEALLRDQAELVRRYEALREKARELSQRNKALEDRLQGALGELQALKEKLEADERARRAEMERTGETVERQRAIIAKLLEETEEELERGG